MIDRGPCVNNSACLQSLEQHALINFACYWVKNFYFISSIRFEEKIIRFGSY